MTKKGKNKNHSFSNGMEEYKNLETNTKEGTEESHFFDGNKNQTDSNSKDEKVANVQVNSDDNTSEIKDNKDIIFVQKEDGSYYSKEVEATGKTAKKSSYEFVQNSDGSFQLKKKNSKVKKLSAKGSILDDEQQIDMYEIEEDSPAPQPAASTAQSDVAALDGTDKKKKVKEKKSKKQENDEKHKKSFKERMRIMGVLLVLGIFTGSGLGVWYFNTVLRSDVNYNDYNRSEYEVSADEILKQVYGITSNQENWLEVAKSSELNNPSKLTADQNFILAQYNATLADTYQSIGNGQVDAGIAKQSVYGERNFDGQRYSFESISKGMLDIAICSYMEKGAKNVDFYKGKNIVYDDAEWVFNQTYTNQAYIDYAGSLPNVIQPYIISSKTIISSSEISYDEETGYYSFTVELDPITSVLGYAKQVKQTSGLSGSPPEFSFVTQTIVIDENWNLISTDVTEKYSVIAFGIKNKCTGTLKTEYFFNCETDIPV